LSLAQYHRSRLTVKRESTRAESANEHPHTVDIAALVKGGYFSVVSPSSRTSFLALQTNIVSIDRTFKDLDHLHEDEEKEHHEVERSDERLVLHFVFDEHRLVGIVTDHLANTMCTHTAKP